jgi:4-hydroxy-tetrahydrodipicolinate reductase
MPIRVMFIGLGPIGTGVVRQVAARGGFRIVGAVDIDPEKAGKDLGVAAGLRRRLRVPVADDVASCLKRTKPDAVVLCTSSSLQQVQRQLNTILKARVPVVSTTEELAYPWTTQPRLARRIDAQARKARVAVLGTGVNPGFAMDSLPVTLTGICERVDSIRVERVQDARIRRLPFQLKIGAGLNRSEFMARVRELRVRHVGLAESVSMIAAALGWKLDRITDRVRPKLAAKPVRSQHLSVRRGQACGLIQDGIGYRNGKALITLHMEAYLGAPETYDAVTIKGSPALRFEAIGGIHGDTATAAIVVNSIPKVIAAAPGLHTMLSLPIPSFFRGGRGART